MDHASIINFLSNEDTGKQACFELASGYLHFRLFGEKWQSLGERLKKGCMVSIHGHLEQDKWEQDGKKHSGIRIAAERVRILGKAEYAGPEPEAQPDLSPSENPGAAETGQEGE